MPPTLLLCGLLLSSTAALAGPRPDWLSGESPSYPKSAYILGVGEAASQEQAADKARAEIAKAFGVALTAKTETSAKEMGDAKSSSLTQSVSDEVKTSAAKFLDGVEVVQYWRDEEGRHHALAVLNRQHNLKVLADKLGELDKDFSSDAAALAKTDGKFSRLRLALKLLRAAKTRRRLNENYRILNPEGKGVAAADSARETLAEASKAVKAIAVAVEAEGALPEKTAARVAAGLAAYGLKTIPAGKTADVIVRAHGVGEPLRPENITWFWARGTLSVTLYYGATGEAFKSFEESGEQAARDPGGCVEAVLSALADRAADRVYQVLTSPEALDD